MLNSDVSFTGYIYKITIPKTGRFYIGSTVDIAKRFEEHRKDCEAGTKRKIYNAMRFYKTYEMEVWKTYEGLHDRKDLFDIEQNLIEEYDNINNGYNDIKASKNE